MITESQLLSTFGIGLLGALGFYYAYLKRHSGKLPPGPFFNPFGRIYGRNGKEAAANILGLKKYGDVCSMNVMGTICIYLNTHEKIRQSYVTNGEITSGRYDMRKLDFRFTEARGLIANDGPSWQENRRFVLSALRDFGFGRGGTEQIVQKELQELIEECANHSAQAFNPQVMLNAATCNVISSLIFGEREGSGGDFATYLNTVLLLMQKTNSVHEQVAVFMMRIISKMPKFMKKRAMKQIEPIGEYFKKKVANHKEKFNGEVHDLVDCYLKRLADEKDSKMDSNFTESELFAIINDLFFAGMETTASTLRWSVLFMIQNQEVMKRVQAELDETLDGRIPSLSDKKDLVYTDAVLMEVQRFASMAPLGAIHHLCTQDTTIDGYHIPKDSRLYANIFAAHRDEKVWPDAFHFNPDNFYDAQSKSIKNSEYLISFGVGRRSCLGESLAKQELFILFCGLLQKFDFVAPDDKACPSVDDCFFGSLRIPPAFEVVFKPRVR